ncbi:MAG: hypothetical protein NXI31_00720 [bacterium]|nr:hypothetical protein [bacterium]
MNQLLLRSATICAALGLALPGSAQDDNSAQPYRTLSGGRLPVNHALTPIHTGVGEEGISYGIWGAGDRYKVSFHDGATFVPYLGRDYPTNQPLRWRTLSAKVGDQELATVTQPRVTYDGLRAEYELGAIVEAYDIRAEGLEQTFVISARPEVPGDLVIRGTLDTALVADPRGPEHAGIEFRDTAGVPILSYGAATAIDAAGRSVTMTTAFEDGQVTLRLDAGFVETATYPLVVDPLLGVIYSIGGSEIESVDLVRDPFGASRNVWRAAARFSSANDGDLYLRRFNDDGSSDLAMFSDLSTSWSSVEVSLGKHVDTGKILLGFTRLTTTGNSYARLHLDRRNNVTFGSSILSIPTGAGHNWRTDVASELGTAFVADYLLVVYQRDVASSFANTQTSQIWGVAVDVSGNGSVGTPFAIADEPFEDYERPTVGNHRFGQQEWAVANQVIGNSPALSPHVNWDIELRVVERTGGVSVPTNIGVGDSQHQMAPRLAGVNDLQFVAYTRSAESVVGPRPAGDNGMAVITERREWNGTSFVKPYGGYMHAANQDPRVVLTGIDFTARRRATVS